MICTKHCSNLCVDPYTQSLSAETFFSINCPHRLTIVCCNCYIDVVFDGASQCFPAEQMFCKQSSFSMFKLCASQPLLSASRWQQVAWLSPNKMFVNEHMII